MSKSGNTQFWRRIDTSGHDACRLLETSAGRRLEGSAVFAYQGETCCLGYTVDCNKAWHTRRASVTGFLGGETLVLEIERSANGIWSLNGTVQPAAEGCIDVDLGFTPATNLLFIRRAALAVGAFAPAPAAYLAFPELKLDRLEQTYERVGEDAYAYTAPAFGYADTLKVSPEGFVTDYPGLWRAETGTG